MNKKIVAIILEIIPVLSAPLSFIFVILPYNSKLISGIIGITFLLAFLGFISFFIGLKLDKESKTIRILGILDWLATIYVIIFYTIAIFSFGL